jgi:uncharacterized membrane protein YhaH (DUF805 family)
MRVTDILFSFNGRIRRRTWWLWSLLVAAVILAGEFTAFPLIAHKSFMEAALVIKTDPVVKGIMVGLALLMLWPSLAINIKRGHDRNRPAALIAGLIVAGQVITFMPAIDTTIDTILKIFQFVISLYLFIELGFVDGTKGPNRFGPSPKQPDAAEAFA